MGWGPYLAVAVSHGIAEGPNPSTDPVAAAVSQVLGFGILGVAVIILGWVLYRGSFVPEKRVDAMIAAGRADLLREIEAVRQEKRKAEEQRDAALKVAQEHLVPLLTSFVATSQSLLPLLQELVRNRER